MPAGRRIELVLCGLILVARVHSVPLSRVSGCLGKAHRHPMELLPHIANPKTRPVPDVSADLGASDWPPGATGTWDGQLKEDEPPPEHLCNREDVSTLWYKLWHGILYARGDDHVKDGVWWRGPIIQQILSAVWLYKGLPDELDIFVCSCDSPCVCSDMQVPFLQYTIINLTSPVPGYGQINVHPSHLLDRGSSMHYYGPGEGLNYTRGYVVSDPETWSHMSLSPKQLRTYAECVQEGVKSSAARRARSEHEQELAAGATGRALLQDFEEEEEEGGTKDAWAAMRIPRVIWRGSSTGLTRGWPLSTGSSPRNHKNEAASLLMNKRAYLAALARPYPWLDIGLSDYNMLGEEIWGGTKGTQLREVLLKPPVPLEHWAYYMFELSIDGFGQPWRLSKMLLHGTPIIRVDSPFREFWAHHFKPGVHYEPVSYDLRDLVQRSHDLIQEAKADSTRFQAMAVAAREEGIGRYNVLAQLDNIAWALLKVEQASPWQVEPPYIDELDPALANWTMTPAGWAAAEAWERKHMKGRGNAGADGGGGGGADTNNNGRQLLGGRGLHQDDIPDEGLALRPRDRQTGPGGGQQQPQQQPQQKQKQEVDDVWVADGAEKEGGQQRKQDDRQQQGMNNGADNNKGQEQERGQQQQQQQQQQEVAVDDGWVHEGKQDGVRLAKGNKGEGGAGKESRAAEQQQEGGKDGGQQQQEQQQPKQDGNGWEDEGLGNPKKDIRKVEQKEEEQEGQKKGPLDGLTNRVRTSNGKGPGRGWRIVKMKASNKWNPGIRHIQQALINEGHPNIDPDN